MFELVIPSILVGFFSILLIFRALHKPFVYSKQILKPRKASILSSTVFMGENSQFFIIPNMCIALIFNKQVLRFNFGEFCFSLCNPNTCTCKKDGLKYNFSKDKLKITGQGNFQCLVSYPQCNFVYNKKKNCLSIGKMKIEFKNFVDLSIKGNKTLSISAKICGEAEIDYTSFNFRISTQDNSLSLKHYFGFYDTNEWKAMPEFSADTKAENSLKRNYLKSLLSENKKTVNLMKTVDAEYLAINKMVQSFNGVVLINLDKLGLSQLVKIVRHKNIIKLTDLLVNFDITLQFNNDQFDYQRCCILGINYLYLSTNKKNTLQISCFQKLIDNSKLNLKLIQGINLSLVEVNSLNSFFINLNRLIIHGIYFDIYTLFKLMRIRYLNEEIKQKFANLLLNYICVFNRFELLCICDVKEFLFSEMKKAINIISVEGYLFLKKILPFITDEKYADIVLDVIINNKDKIKSNDYEFYVNEILGMRLSGHKLFFEPKRDALFEISIWIGGHKLNISKKVKSKIFKIDNIIMNGIEFIDLSLYPAEIFIEFVD